jgi:hypothetical protein
MSHPIALLTDFGLLDPYVGIMKGVIASLAPDAPVIELSHAIPPGDVARAAFVLWQARPYFAAGTIFVAVVDPGVGTSRRPLLLQAGDKTFVGPDNGLFSYVMGGQPRAWEICNPALRLPQTSMTFHGRDIFAPAAAHAARGIPGDQFGPACQDLRVLAPPRLTASPGEINGQVLHADGFGNLITSLGKFFPENAGDMELRPWIGNPVKVRLPRASSRLILPDGQILPWVQTFAEIPAGRCAILVGSSGLIEIVANRQSAANLLNLGGGELVTLRF